MQQSKKIFIGGLHYEEKTSIKTGIVSSIGNGVSYTAEFYDNYGVKFLNVSGKRIDIDGNIVEEVGVDSDGNTITNYSLSSVITIAN